MRDLIQSHEKSNHHIHITGAQSPDDMRMIAGFAEVDITPYEPLEANLQFDNPAIWAAAKEITSAPAGLFLAIANIVDQQKQDNVTYIELTINPFGMLSRGLSQIELSDTLTTAHEYAQSLGITVLIKLGVNRKDGPESIDVVHAAYDACPDNVRFGIDLNGDEQRYPTDSFRLGFLALSKLGIATSIHAGEYPHLTTSLRDALDARPTRIGHAVATLLDSYSLERIKNEGIIVESSPLSSAALGAVPTVQVHPVKMMHDSGIKLVFGTDDPAFFGNTMTDEFSALHEIGLTAEEILRTIKKANSTR